MQAYLNGQFLPLEECKISVMDRGFLFGDGVYDAIPVIDGVLFHFDKHFERLSDSLAAIRIDLPIDHDTLRGVLEELVTRNEGKNQSTYLEITRGAPSMRTHIFPDSPITPTVFAYSYPRVQKTIDELSEGIFVITQNDFRWQRCDIKAITLLPNILMRQIAEDAGAQETILIRDGIAIEASSSNLFVVINGVIKTAPLNHTILGGVTRDLVIDVAKSNGLNLEETYVSLNELLTADEVWITSSNRDIQPVIKIDETIINNGKSGPLWRTMMQHFEAYKLKYVEQKTQAA